ncbi:MAG: ATP synthase F1 subunit delta [Flavobacteriales bacterium CG_4_9_14_3_um_filter_40_17]|nr:MAG: ATP synthase F1 subunit delta [Flavobacteriales bacterium CG_4_9_14_3_um_filter_40_17]
MSRINRAAARYAEALLELANEAKIQEKIAADAREILKVIGENKDLRALLKSPIVKPEVKKDILTEVFSNVQKLTLQTFGVLSNSRRFDLLEEVLESYLLALNSEKGFVSASVTTAVPLTDALRVKILAKVKALSGNEGLLTENIDENIIGGFVLRVGDIEFNASLKHQFDQLKEVLVN